jgi:hypothetical protein
MKENIIFADMIQPFRMTDREYIEMLEEKIDEADTAIYKSIMEMDSAFLKVENINEDCLYLYNKWKEFKTSLGL